MYIPTIKKKEKNGKGFISCLPLFRICTHERVQMHATQAAPTLKHDKGPRDTIAAEDSDTYIYLSLILLPPSLSFSSSLSLPDPSPSSLSFSSISLSLSPFFFPG